MKVAVNKKEIEGREIGLKNTLLIMGNISDSSFSNIKSSFLNEKRVISTTERSIVTTDQSVVTTDQSVVTTDQSVVTTDQSVVTTDRSVAAFNIIMIILWSIINNIKLVFLSLKV